jgi:hypothetical protein
MKTLHSLCLYLILTTTAQAAGLLEINTDLTPKNNASVEDSKTSSEHIDLQRFYIGLIRHLKKA